MAARQLDLLIAIGYCFAVFTGALSCDDCGGVIILLLSA
jgi:hypothetical protein